jgi:signal transduction histidine kinase
MPSNCYVLANELIGEMLSTVIKNAITHNYRDGPEVVISIDSMADEFNNKTFWEISISDNGPGIPDERKTPIFDLVAQIGESSGITGVSLSMAKSIVMLYGGSIWVENRVPTDRSRGSTFRILLPVA